MRVGTQPGTSIFLVSRGAVCLLVMPGHVLQVYQNNILKKRAQYILRPKLPGGSVAAEAICQIWGEGVAPTDHLKPTIAQNYWQSNIDRGAHGNVAMNDI